MIGRIFQRIWTAIVAAVAGAAIGLAASVVMVKYGRPIDEALPLVSIFAMAGFLLGLLWGGGKTAA
jgi:presenilin-like A22 family membrane protease